VRRRADVFVLLETTLQSGTLSGSRSMHFLLTPLALTLFTLVSMMAAGNFIRRSRHYEATRDCERLLFSNARDAMLLIGVRRNPVSQRTPFTLS